MVNGVTITDAPKVEKVPPLGKFPPVESLKPVESCGTVSLGADRAESLKAVEEYREKAARGAQWRGPAQTKDGHRAQ